MKLQFRHQGFQADEAKVVCAVFDNRISLRV
jgi:hypothetical protein